MNCQNLLNLSEKTHLRIPTIETLIIPESVTSIGMISNLSIREFILPESVKEIKGYLAQPFPFDTLIIRSTELVCNAEFYPISGCKIQNLYCTKFVYNANFEGSAVFEKVHLLD